MFLKPLLRHGAVTSSKDRGGRMVLLAHGRMPHEARVTAKMLQPCFPKAMGSLRDITAHAALWG